MYINGKISDLVPIEIPEIENFITSSLNEIDYFNCNKSDLVSLKEFLLELKWKKREYDRLIAKPLKFIQEKNPWCNDIQPANINNYIMEAQAKNYPSIFIGDYNQNLVSGGIAYSSIDPRSFLYKNRLYQRSKIINNSKDELLEIKNIIREFGFNNEDEGFVTVSNHFLVIPYNFEEVHIQKKRKTSMYHKIQLDQKGEFISDYCGMTHFDNKKTKKYADSFVKKLYLSK